MRISMRTSMGGTPSLHYGQELDVDDAIGAEWVSRGMAVAVAGPAPVALEAAVDQAPAEAAVDQTVVEDATQALDAPAVEQAVTRSSRKPRQRRG